MQKTNCPICHNPQNQKLFDVKKFSIQSCKKCDTVFTYPFIAPQEIEKFYPKIYLWEEKNQTKHTGIFFKFFNKVEEKYFKNNIYKQDAKKMLKIIQKTGKILDIGCGTGIRLNIFKNMDFEPYGIEPFVTTPQDLPIEKICLYNYDYKSKKSFFDIITLYHVFEHFDKPIEHLHIIKYLLKHDGWLVVQVPNFDSWQAKLFKNKWRSLDVPTHYFHYTPSTLKKLLLREGFDIVKTDQTINFTRPFSWIFSFSSLDPQKIWSDERSGKKTYFKKFYLGILLLIFIIPNTVETLFGHGGQFTIYARNKK